jgi:hypothetical protein
MRIDEKTLHWLAGYLEGEGSFMKGSPSNPNQPIIVVSSTDEDVIQNVSQLFERRYQKVSNERGAERGWKPAFVVRLRGTKAVGLMRELLPLMGERRKVQIQKALDSYNPDIKKKLSDQQVLEILSTPLEKRGSQKALARRYSVSRWTIRNVLEGKERFAIINR